MTAACETTTENTYGEELTLDLEQLLAPPRQISVSIGTTVTSQSTDSRSVARLPVITGLGQIVDIPITLGEGDVVEDSLLPFAAIRYGATRNLQLSLTATATYQDQRTTQESIEVSQDKEFDFNHLALGFTYRLKRETATPALLLFANTSLRDQAGMRESGRHNFSSSTFGFTTFKTIDPVVLSARVGYRYAREIDGIALGDVLFTDFGVSFAVNRNVTISGGLSTTLQKPGNIEDQSIDTRRTNTSLDFGLGLALDQNNILFLNTRSFIVGAEQSSITLTYSRTV